jgi:hypothetical protein
MTATPDRTVQRIALGSGVGAGAVAAGVYFGPLLVGVLTAMAANLAILTLLVVALAVAMAWGVVTVVRSVGGSDGKAPPSACVADAEARHIRQRQRRLRITW